MILISSQTNDVSSYGDITKTKEFSFVFELSYPVITGRFVENITFKKLLCLFSLIAFY